MLFRRNNLDAVPTVNPATSDIHQGAAHPRSRSFLSSACLEKIDRPAKQQHFAHHATGSGDHGNRASGMSPTSTHGFLKGSRAKASGQRLAITALAAACISIIGGLLVSRVADSKWTTLSSGSAMTLQPARRTFKQKSTSPNSTGSE